MLYSILPLGKMSVHRQGKGRREVADMNLIIQSFSKCQRQNGTLSTDHYLCACNELVW